MKGCVRRYERQREAERVCERVRERQRESGREADNERLRSQVWYDIIPTLSSLNEAKPS